MSNEIPTGAIPKLFQLKDGKGNPVGNWRVNVKGKPVNLRTKNYIVARERARAAVYSGQREFEDDRNVDVPRLGPMPTENPAPPPSVSGDWTSDVASAASAGLKPEVFPPEMPPLLPQYETKADNSNAEYGAPKTSTSNGDSTKISPEMLEGIIKQAAQVFVELQIQGQEYLWARWGKIEAGPVAPDHQSRKISQDIWEQAIREWIPPDLPIPPWLLAPIVCAALTVPVQIEGAKPLPKKPTEPVT